MKPSEFRFYFSAESYDEKTAKNYWNYYVAEKRIVSKLSKILNQNFNSTNWKLESRLCENLTFLSFIASDK